MVSRVVSVIGAGQGRLRVGLCILCMCAVSHGHRIMCAQVVSVSETLPDREDQCGAQDHWAWQRWLRLLSGLTLVNPILSPATQQVPFPHSILVLSYLTLCPQVPSGYLQQR